LQDLNCPAVHNFEVFRDYYDLLLKTVKSKRKVGFSLGSGDGNMFESGSNIRDEKKFSDPG
jgi:hypothetical protein